MRKIKRISGIIICVLTIFAIWYVINMVRISSYSKKSFDCKSDVALVLGAGTYNGQLSPVYRERVNHAINLLQIDSVKYILLTGGYGENQAISDSEVARQYVLSKG